MQLIAFIHGIGNFYPETQDKVRLLETMQRDADDLYGEGNSRVVFLSYEKILDGYATTKAVSFASSAAAAYYAGTPGLGSLIADFGTDIFQYYLSRKVRRDVCKAVVAQLVMAIAREPQGVTGVTLVGHSLGSLVTLRVLHMVQVMCSKNGKLQLSDKLIDELLSDHVLERDILTIGDLPMNVVIMGSPAFSRLKGIKYTTRKLALAESKVEDVFANQVILKRPILVSTYSESIFADALSGPVEDKFQAVDIQVPTNHANVTVPLRSYFNYLAPGVRSLQVFKKEGG